MIKTVEKKYCQITNEFSCYKVIYTNELEVFVPHNQANKDYQAIQEWIAAGNTVIDNPPE
jgi:hypothetical protein